MKTDYYIGIRTGGVTCRLLQIYGWCIVIPIFLNLSFTIVLFVNDFCDQKANIYELIPLVLLVYPQYKTIKFLSKYIFIHRDEELLNEEKEKHNRDVATLEPFLESCLQVNTSLAILFATEGFYPKDGNGITITYYQDFKSALPLITFLLSLFSSAFGMSKFFLAGPIQFLSSDSTFNGILSIPFLGLCIINSMFGIRIFCIENIFFTNYRRQINYATTLLLDTKQIAPIISPEYRLLVYLAPCIISFLCNCFKIRRTAKGLKEYLLKYPQFLIAPCFTPFMFEGYKQTNNYGQYKIRIWKWGSIINAVYIGCIPQCILIVSDYYKGVHNWEFAGIHSSGNDEVNEFEANDALFKSKYGNIIFASSTITICLTTITFFFGSGWFFRNRGIHCRFLTFLCCPCPAPCISYTGKLAASSSKSEAPEQSITGENIEEQISTQKQSMKINLPHTDVYFYTKRSESKIRLLGPSSMGKDDIEFKEFEKDSEQDHNIGNDTLQQENSDAILKDMEDEPKVETNIKEIQENLSQISSASPETAEIHAEVGSTYNDDVSISENEVSSPDYEIGDEQKQEQNNSHEKLEASKVET